MDHGISNKMSVIAVDEKTDEIAGVCLARDLHENPDGFEKVYTDPSNNLTAWMDVAHHMEEKIEEIMPDVMVQVVKNVGILIFKGTFSNNLFRLKSKILQKVVTTC